MKVIAKLMKKKDSIKLKKPIYTTTTKYKITVKRILQNILYKYIYGNE